MAIIGQSKNSDLYQKVTTEGTKYRDIKYSDVSDTEPLIVKELPGLTDQTGGAGFIPDVSREVTARIDDTARIAKLLTKYQGIKWQGHNAALTAIQNELDNKRGRYTGQSTNLGNILGTLVNVGRGALKALDLDAVTLAQVAVAGTGEHFTAWQNRAYINDTGTFSGAIGNILAQLGIDSSNGSAAQSALATGKVLINPDNINGRQLPDINNEALREAQKPGPVGSKITGFFDPRTAYKRGGKWIPENPNSEELPYEKLEVETEASRSRWIGDYNIDDTGSLLEAQRPKMTIPQYGEVSTGPAADGSVSWSLQNWDNPKLELYSASAAELGQLSPTKHGMYSVSGSKPTDSNSIGPWRPEGVYSLVAATTLNNSSAPSDNNSSNNTKTLERRWVRGDASTRVDNGRIEMIPFYIRAICPGGTGEYGSGRAPSGENGYLFFEANLDSYSDNYEANWQGTEYIGRADKFWNYNGFDRQISFSFKMVAHSKSHLRPIYNRLNGLLSMTTPTYGTQADGGSFMRGTLAEITIGDLLSQQLGFIKSVGLKWETDYMWETDTGTIMVPHVLDVSVNFTPIHRFVPHTDLRYFQLVNSGSKAVDTFVVNHTVLYRK